MPRQKILYSKKDSLWKNHKVKIASTLFAILVWFLIITGDSFNYSVSVTIEVQKIHNDLILTSPIPENAKILLRGPGISLLGIALFRDLKLELELNWRKGPQTVALSENSIELSGGSQRVKIVDLISPKEIDITIEELEVEKVPVRSRLEIRPFRGYTIVGEVEFQPDSVIAQAPRRILDSLFFIPTQKKEFKNLKYPFENKIELEPPQDELIKLSDHQVNARADIQKLMERQIQRVPVSIINVPVNMKAIVIPSQLSLVVEGGVEIISQVKPEDIEAYIDYDKYKDPKENAYPAFIKPLPFVRYRDITPQRFKVVLERKAG